MHILNGLGTILECTDISERVLVNSLVLHGLVNYKKDIYLHYIK